MQLEEMARAMASGWEEQRALSPPTLEPPFGWTRRTGGSNLSRDHTPSRGLCPRSKEENFTCSFGNLTCCAL